MRIANALNPNQLKTLPPGEHCDGAGLYLVVSDTGARSWLVKYQWGKNRTLKMGIGSLLNVTLASARETASDIRKQARNGIDPKLERDKALAAAGPQASEAKVLTFKDFGTKLCERWVEGMKNDKSKAKLRRAVNVWAAHLHDMALDKITPTDVADALAPIWISKSEAAKYTRGVIERVLGAAKAAGHIDRNMLNPAMWRDNLKHLMAKPPKKGSARGKHKALPYAEMPQFMTELRAMNVQSARMLEVLILTCARTGELLQMQWDQVDLDNGRWTLPGKVMKNGLQADVPLTATVIAILRKIKEARWDDTYVFPGLSVGTICSTNTMLKLLKVDMKRKATCHGFRASFRSWGQNETDIARDVLEYCLHHIEGGEAELAYARGDVWQKRQAALKDWETYCNSKPAPKLRLVA